MSSKISIILISLVLLYSFGIHEALAQEQPPPLVPPVVEYGLAHIDGGVLGDDHNVSIKMDLFLVVFLDGSDDQDLIASELQGASISGGRVHLPELQDAFAESSNPPTSLSNNTSVADIAPLSTDWPVIGCWQVNDWDNSNTYTVQIIEPVPGKEVLEVYQHNGVIASCNTTSSYLAYDCNYVLEIPIYSNEALGEGDYVLREAGKATASSPFNKGYAYVDDIRATDPSSVVIDGSIDVMKRDIYAPSTHTFAMELEEGWNLFSFPINKCFYQGGEPTDQPDCVELVDINQLGFETMAQWFNSILEPNDLGPSGYVWRIVTGFKGTMDSELLEASDLEYMSPCFSYYVKIYKGVGKIKLTLDGPLFDPSCKIPLPKGWNMVGFPLTTGFYSTSLPPEGAPEGTTWVKVSEPLAEQVFDSIAGKYRIITGFIGTYDSTLPEASDLDYLVPGCGFFIKTSEATELEYPAQ